MAVRGLDLYENYAELNAELEENGNPVRLSNDEHVEDPACIVVVYKWTDSGFPAEGPDLSFLGLESAQHVALSDKWDAFIYTR